MKLPHLHPLSRSLALLVCLLALSCGWARAQQPVAIRLDVYFGETKLLPIDGPVDDFNVADDKVIKVTKTEGSPNELTIVALAGGNTALTVKSGDRTLIYDVAVSPAPERLYINLNESKRLTFPDPIDDTNLSQAGIVRIVQPDSTDKVLLVEANTAGKATLTVYSKGEIYRYFISTFENRGADILEIENAFASKGYRNLTITFDKDQAVIGGTVPTQEELDDAVHIVKQYTEYVNVKAQLGQAIEQSEYSEEESIIINNIQRIANVKGLTVRVKFPMPTVITTSTYTKSVGDYITPTTTTTPQGGTIRGSGFQPPTPQQQGPNATGPTEPKPQENTTQTVTTTENTSVPEKIFLYGDMEDDLDEAKVIRVARTFCPFIVNFMTVKDPIQLRAKILFLQVANTDTRDTGFTWVGNGTSGGPTITLGFGGSNSVWDLLPNPLTAFKNFITSPLSAIPGTNTLATYSQGVYAAVSASAVLNLYQKLALTKVLRQAEIFLTNGQPGWYSEGEVESYISSTVVSASNPPVTTLTASSVFLGVNMDIAPLDIQDSGGTLAAGQKIFGIPSSVASTGGAGYTLSQDTTQDAEKVSSVATPIQLTGKVPIVDNTIKYVDENGLIGMNISTQLTLPGPGGLRGTTVQINGGNGGAIDLPNFFVRTTRTRANLRDGQSVAIDGLIDREVTKNITEVPFLSSIPLFGSFFRGHSDENDNQEVIVLVTPTIIRLRDPDSARFPKPHFPDMADMARDADHVPIIKPVRYEPGDIDLRPESPKDMKEAKSASTPTEAPLAPRATGGMQTLQAPPVESTPAKPAAVDNTPAAPDNSRQPSNAPLAPTSTLP